MRSADDAQRQRQRLIQEIQKSALEIGIAGPHATITCPEKPDSGVEEIIKQEKFDLVARVYVAHPLRDLHKGIRIYRGTAFGYLSDGERGCGSILGLHRDVYVVGACQVRRPPTAFCESCEPIKPDCRLVKTLAHARAIARIVASALPAWNEFDSQRRSKLKEKMAERQARRAALQGDNVEALSEDEFWAIATTFQDNNAKPFPEDAGIGADA